jgi:AraC-type DNA-binding domain-containing proteins
MARVADGVGLVNPQRAPLPRETLGALAEALVTGDRPRVSLLASVAVGILALSEGNDGSARHAVARARVGCNRVRREIDLALAQGRPEIAIVAGRLGLTVRSLQRLLARAGTSFSRMVEDVRMERALALLHGGGHRIQDVAEACGYADLSSFHRAFRRRFGRTPGATARQVQPARRDTPGRIASS